MKFHQKYIWLITVFWSLATAIIAQPSMSMQEQQKQAIDSLQGLLLQAENDSLKAVLYTNLSGIYLFTNQPKDAIGAAERALALAKKKGANNMISNAYAQLGRVHMETGEYSLSIDAYQQSIAVLGDTGYVLPKTLRLQMLGKAYELQQIYDVAKAKYQQGYELLKTQQDSSTAYLGLAAFCLNNLGNIAAVQEDLEQGLTYQLEALEIRRQMGDSLNLAFSYNDIAVIYAQMERMEESKNYYEQAWQIFLQMGKKRELAIVGSNLAGIALGLNNAKLALTYALESIQNAYAVNEKGAIASTSLVLANIYSELGLYKEAYEAQQTHAIYTDSIFNEQRLREIGRLESQLELQEKEMQNQQQQIVIEQQQTTNLIIGSALVMLLFLSGMLLRLQYQQKKANRLLQLQNEEINEQKDELTAQSAVLKAANEEIRQQKEEIYAQAEALRQVNEETQQKNDLLSQQNELIEKKNSDILSSINYASRIQNALLPFDDRLKKAFDSCFVLYQPRDIVSGDFYWFQEVGQKQIIAAVDCTGHGVPGAFMSVLGHGALEDIVLRQGILSPEKILDQLDAYIHQALQQEHSENRDGMDAAICVIDREAQFLWFAGAKNPLVLFQNGGMQVIKGDSTAIGGRSSKSQNHHYTLHEFPIHHPTTCYIYSDGYQDQFGGAHGKKLMAKKFRSILQEIQPLPMNQQQTLLITKMQEWKGDAHRQIDDILVIGINI